MWNPGKSWEPFQPALPVGDTDAFILECQSHQLLGEQVERSRRWDYRLDMSTAPQFQQRPGTQQGLVARGQEQAVADCTRPAAGSSDPLEE